VALSLTFIGIGLIGYPIVTILYGFALVSIGGIGLWSRKHPKRLRLFLFPFLKEIYDGDSDGHSKPDADKPHADLSNFRKETNHKTNDNHGYTKKDNPRHTAPPKGKTL